MAAGRGTPLRKASFVKRYLTMLLVFVAALAALVGAATGPAAADFRWDRAAAAPAATPDSATTDPLRFWTKERMAQAEPADVPAGPHSDASVQDEVTADGPAVAHPGALPQTLAGPTAATELSPMAGGFEWPGPQHAAPASTTGRIFWTTPGKTHFCSGSAVNSGNKDLVFTAGHCIHGGAGGGYFMNHNWVFAPNYRDGFDPIYGIWTPRRMQTTSGWANSTDHRYDMGVALMNTNFFGQHLVNVVGGQAIIWNLPSAQFMIAFGYPAVGQYNGDRLIYCNGNTFLDNNKAAPKPVGLNCDQTPGASGGPWLRGFNANTGLGQLNSVFSYFYTINPNQWFGPYFGSAAGNLFNANANL